MKKLGIRVSPYDPCVYIHNPNKVIVTIHVEDIKICHVSQANIDALKKRLVNVFNITEESPDTTYLGIHIEQH
jgi:hypothetical protein